MAQERLSMRKIKEILRLRWELGFSRRQTARSCRISHSTVSEYENRARQAGLSWPFPEDLDEGSLESLLFPQKRRTQRPKFTSNPGYDSSPSGTTKTWGYPPVTMG